MRIRNCIIALALVIVFTITFVACTPEATPGSDPIAPIAPIEILVFGIGRSDAILITTENYVMMIDTGERQHGPKIADYLLRQDITTIDYLIITHFDGDHVGGAYVILNEIDVKNVIVPNYSRESNHVRRFETALESAQINPLILTETMRFTLDNAEFIVDPSNLEYFHFARHTEDDADDILDETVLIPTGDDFSIVISITHGDNSFLFTGDAVAVRLQELIENDEIMSIDHDLLKVPRHGRHNRRSVEFINTISPQYAVITGFHPDLTADYYPERPTDERVIAALEDVGAEIFFTMSTGVRVRCDGTSLTLSYEDFFAE